MRENNESPVIRLENLAKHFGRVAAVAGISLDVGKGEALTIFGPNGAGKTTLLRMIAGLVKPGGGRIIIAGEEVTHGHHDEIRRKIGYISHQSLVYGQLTAMDNLRFFAELYGVGDPRAVAERLLGEVGLSARAGDPAATFSRGMKQRLSIARALVHDPEIVLLDEPFTGLDQHAAEMLQRMLMRLRNEGRTIVMITHNLNVGITMGTRIAVQAGGKICFDKPASEIDPALFHDIYNRTVGAAHY